MEIDIVELKNEFWAFSKATIERQKGKTETKGNNNRGKFKNYSFAPGFIKSFRLNSELPQKIHQNAEGQKIKNQKIEKITLNSPRSEIRL